MEKSYGLISIKSVQDYLGVRGPLGSVLARVVYGLLGLKKVNAYYPPVSSLHGPEFACGLMRELGVSVEPEGLDRIPAEGPIIIVCNHPYGMIDGLSLLSRVGTIRPDLKIITNFLLSGIENLKDCFMPVNPFADRPGLRSSLPGLRAAMNHLLSGGALAIFPAGQVSSYDNPQHVVRDIDWQPTMMKLVSGAGVPVVPVYFSGQNSDTFHRLGRISPVLRTIRLPYEMTNKHGYKFTMRVGPAVPAAEIASYKDMDELALYLRNRVYAMEGESGTVRTVNASEDVAPAQSPEAIRKELEARECDKLFEVGPYACYLSEYDDIPAIIQEIGVRRELTFRSVGEGTGKAIDLDSYDPYYKHLHLWIRDTCELVGCYRLGIGSDIMRDKGIRGFYSDFFYHYDDAMAPMLRQTIELGRSFVVEAHQNEPLPMDLLLKGVLYATAKTPGIRYFMGPASTSSWYPTLYRSLIYQYMVSNCLNKEYSKYVHPDSGYKPDFGRVVPDRILAAPSIEAFNRQLIRLSGGVYRVPALVKKYIKFGCSLLAFNVDHDFNDALDILVLVDTFHLSKDDIDSHTKEIEDKTEFYSRFHTKA